MQITKTKVNPVISQNHKRVNSIINEKQNKNKISCTVNNITVFRL